MERQNFEFKSLITREEYDRLLAAFPNVKDDMQTNHYFDTRRFSLKAVDISVRVRERDNFELTYKRKKGYAPIVKTFEIEKEDYENIKETGVLENEEVNKEISKYIKTQKLENYLSLGTLRKYLPYLNGVLYFDITTYLGITDYEVGYSSKDYEHGKKTFVDIIRKYNLNYIKAEKKIKRAMIAFRSL